MGCSEYCGCTETECQNKWNNQSSEKLDSDDSEDKSDTDDECQYESSDEKWK